MDFNQVFTLILSGILTGAGICIGFVLIGRNFVEKLIKQMPKWIHEVMSENRKNAAIDRALEGRRQY